MHSSQKIKPILIFLVLLAMFLAFRLPLINNIYHQDEYKWAEIADPFFKMEGESVHPPITELVFHYGGALIGYGHLRWIILAFSLGCFLLIYKLAKKTYGRDSAFFSLILFILVPYSVLASIQIDIDGAILPFWILLTAWSFENVDFKKPLNSRRSVSWIIMLLLSIVGGLLSKLSFILIFPGLFFAFLEKISFRVSKKLFIQSILFVAAPVAGMIIVFLLLSRFYPALPWDRFIGYAKSFQIFNFRERNYPQTAFLITKALLFLSPLAVLMFYMGRDAWKKYKFWLWYVITGLLFYLVIFDFSNRTLDRYLMFLILPLVFIGGDILAGWSKKINWNKGMILKAVVTAALVSLLGVFLLTRNYEILPLNPKSGFISHARQLDFNFLIPFSSGSGPIGFYFSALFIAWFWVLAGAAFLTSIFFKRLRTPLILVMLIFGAGYALVMNFEMAGGRLYGSPDKVARAVINEANASADVSKVMTYNDVGGYDLGKTGKYARRFYTHPEFAEINKIKFKEYSGHILVVDFPEIDKASVYWKFFSTCVEVDSYSDKKINGYIFDCRRGEKRLFN